MVSSDGLADFTMCYLQLERQFTDRLVSRHVNSCMERARLAAGKSVPYLEDFVVVEDLL